jgi:transcription elongation factor
MMPSSNLKKGTCWPSFKKIIEGTNMISRILVLKTQNEEITFTTELS